jgi:hypothetical protein
MSLLSRYIDAKSNLDHFKKLEAELRIQMLEEVFPSASAGTHNFEMEGYKIKGVFKNNTRIDLKHFKSIEGELSAEELDCIRFKPELDMRKYNATSEDERSLLDEAVVVSPAMPTISIDLLEQE